MTQPMTEEIAFAAAEDAANKQMREEGRFRWSKEDYMLARRTFQELYPEKPTGAREAVDAGPATREGRTASGHDSD